MGEKIEGLLSRIVALENDFDSRPSDVAEQRRRDGLRLYVVTFLWRLVLSSFQRVASRRRTIAVSGRDD